MEENKRKELDLLLGYGQVFDISCREIVFRNKTNYLYFDNFLTNSSDIVQLMLGFIETENEVTHDEFDSYFDVIVHHFANHNIKITNNLLEIRDAVLSGLIALIVSETDYVIICDLRQYPGREIGEPDSEKVVRGSRDGFTESIATNMALIRRRVRTGRLRSKLYKIGDYSRTDVALIYIDGYVDKKALKEVEKRIEKVKIHELTMSDKALEELIIGQKYSPYPLVRYTERPDTFAAHLYQGMFGIIVDTSPSAILGPITIFDHMQHAEEYRQTPISGSYLRLLRFVGIILSFLLMPLWYALVKSGIRMPAIFDNIMTTSGNMGLILLQILTAEVGIELLRMASIHTPSSLATSMGLIAGVIIGDIAIELGLFTKTIVLLGSLSAIGSYITPSYELSLANKIVKIILLILIYFLGIYGLIGGVLFLIIYLSTLKSFTKPYLYPLIPLNIKKLLKQFVRLPYRNLSPKD